MTIDMTPVAVVHTSRNEVVDDDWGGVVSEIELDLRFPDEALDGIEEFSHVEIVFHFDRVAGGETESGARHPRGNTAWPRVGIFAQRAKWRPNRIGVTIARLLERRGRILRVTGLDAIDGTPVLDIKPVMREFLPEGEIRQPAWSHELMANYFRRR